MKRTLPFILFLLFLVGCSDISHNSTLNTDDISGNISIIEIDMNKHDWEQVPFPFDLNENVSKEIKPIKTSQDAIQVANALINTLHNNQKMSQYTLVAIARSSPNNIWRFEYAIDQGSVDTKYLIDRESFYIAIDGNSGTLIKAWIG